LHRRQEADVKEGDEYLADDPQYKKAEQEPEQ